MKLFLYIVVRNLLFISVMLVMLAVFLAAMITAWYYGSKVSPVIGIGSAAATFLLMYSLVEYLVERK